jgi:sugar phosphate isomerase/epimerase
MSMMVPVVQVAPPLLAFSTLGCPDWDAETVIRRARAMGFDGIEWRGGPDGTVRTTWSERRRAAVRAAMDDAGLRSIAVTAYSELISGDADVRAASIDDLTEHAALAADLGAPWVRTFVGVADDAAPPDELRRRAVAGLATALARVAWCSVGLALEPHDGHVRARDVEPILAAIPDPRLAVVWDVANGWAAGDSPEVAFEAYDGRIAWIQVKDGTGHGDTWQLGPIGAGEVPLQDALALVVARSRQRQEAVPPISIEWEMAWHPELDPPDVALPAGLRWLRTTLAAIERDGNAEESRGAVTGLAR